MAEELTDQTGHKAEGTLVSLPVNAIMDNAHRPPEVFIDNEDKKEGLKQSMRTEGVWTNVEITKDKWGNFSIAGGGHHRVHAMKELIEAGEAPNIRGLFLKDGEWCAKFVNKKYTKEQQLKMFMLENADAWGKDNQQNVSMMTIQVKDYLDRLVQGSKDVDEFVEKVKSPYPLEMDEAAFTRAKNSGVGANTIVQYLGKNTWSRPVITKAIKVLYEKGEEGEKLRELADKLPNIATAYQFKVLMTQEIDGDKVLSAEADQEKAKKLFDKESLTRTDLEKANKIKKEKGISPLDALAEVVDEKKGELKAEKDAAKAKKDTPDPRKEMPQPEKALDAIKNAVNNVKMLSKDESDWSKAQWTQAESLVKDLAELVLGMKPGTNKGNNKKK